MASDRPESPVPVSVGEVSATFSVTRTTEAGVLIGKAGGAPLFETKATYQRGLE